MPSYIREIMVFFDIYARLPVPVGSVLRSLYPLQLPYNSIAFITTITIYHQLSLSLACARRTQSGAETLFGSLTDSTNNRKCVSNSIQPDLQIHNGFFTRLIIARTQILEHRWGPEEGSCHCFADGLNQSLVPSVAQATSSSS